MKIHLIKRQNAENVDGEIHKMKPLAMKPKTISVDSIPYTQRERGMWHEKFAEVQLSIDNINLRLDAMLHENTALRQRNNDLEREMKELIIKKREQKDEFFKRLLKEK